MIELKNVSYTYNVNTPDAREALKDVTLTVANGETWGIIGHTGSGKSTLTEIMSGLLKPTAGEVWVDGENITKLKNTVKALRGKVGMVFQYPENQLFEESVIKDVCFGPRNMGFDEAECVRRAHEAMELVGLGRKYDNLSPFELSGGQKRRVAIAGVIAMQPETLILDEPTAGLDPVGRDNLLDTLKKIKGTMCESVVLVSHSMEDVASFADKVLVMKEGRISLSDHVREVFRQVDALEEAGLDVPQVTRLMHKLKGKGHELDTSILTIEEAAEAIYRILKG